MNENPNPRQLPLVGFTREKVLSAEDHARFALKQLDEIIRHRLSNEEVLRNIAVCTLELQQVIDELAKAQLAGVPKQSNQED